MSWDIILEILKWLIPLGGFGSIAKWFVNRTERELKRIRDSHDAYKTMYEDVKMTLNEEIEEKRALRKALGRFERAISKVFGCKHYPNCPVNVELLHQQADNPKSKQASYRQHRNKGNPGSDPGQSARVENGANDTDGEPP